MDLKVTLNTRTLEQRLWKQDNVDKVRDNNRRSYLKHAEKRKKKALARWKRKKELGLDTSEFERIAKIVNLPPTVFYKCRYIRKFGRRLYNDALEENSPSTHGIYLKVRNEMKTFLEDVRSRLVRKKVKELSNYDVQEITEKYDNLTYPFGIV